MSKYVTTREHHQPQPRPLTRPGKIADNGKPSTTTGDSLTMPYSTQDPSRYPVHVVTAWTAAIMRREHTIPCKDKAQAAKIRLQLNSYRSACRNSGDRNTRQYDAMEIIIRPTNPAAQDKHSPHTVLIRSVDDSETAKVIAASLKGIDLSGNNAEPEWEDAPADLPPLDVDNLAPGGSLFGKEDE